MAGIKLSSLISKTNINISYLNFLLVQDLPNLLPHLASNLCVIYSCNFCVTVFPSCVHFRPFVIDLQAIEMPLSRTVAKAHFTSKAAVLVTKGKGSEAAIRGGKKIPKRMCHRL